jgi:hypothetical protein
VWALSRGRKKNGNGHSDDAMLRAPLSAYECETIWSSLAAQLPFGIADEQLREKFMAFCATVPQSKAHCLRQLAQVSPHSPPPSPECQQVLAPFAREMEAHIESMFHQAASQMTNGASAEEQPVPAPEGIGAYVRDPGFRGF